MNRIIARTIHETTNIAYWLENPDWKSGSRFGDLALHAFRQLPFSTYELQKNMFFKNKDDVTVSGESVVVAGESTVDKFMFRFPGTMSLDRFKTNVESEVSAVVRSLSGIALNTTVSIKSADIFKRPFNATDAVAQTQAKVDLRENPALQINDIVGQIPSGLLDKTARDLDIMRQGIDTLLEEYGYYPDIAFSSSNLRRNVHDGDITLIDVMPIHADGTRLIGDSPSKLPHTLDALRDIEEFVGTFGS